MIARAGLWIAVGTALGFIRTDLDGKKVIAVINRDGRQLAHHNFQMRQDGSPPHPENNWRSQKGDSIQKLVYRIKDH